MYLIMSLTNVEDAKPWCCCLFSYRIHQRKIVSWDQYSKELTTGDPCSELFSLVEGPSAHLC